MNEPPPAPPTPPPGEDLDDLPAVVGNVNGGELIFSSFFIKEMLKQQCKRLVGTD